jgi:hypothetical protein
MFGITAATMALSFGLPALALALLAGAGAAFVYIPIVGRTLAVGLLIASAGVFAFDAGYRERAGLDASATLRAQLAVAAEQAARAKADQIYAQGVAKDAAAAQELAEDEANQAAKQVEEYATELSHRAPSFNCGLTAGDVAGLRRIGGK